MKFDAHSAIDLLRGQHGLTGDGPERIADVIEDLLAQIDHLKSHPAVVNQTLADRARRQQEALLRASGRQAAFIKVGLALVDRLGDDCCDQVAGDHALTCPRIEFDGLTDLALTRLSEEVARSGDVHLHLQSAPTQSEE